MGIGLAANWVQVIWGTCAFIAFWGAYFVRQKKVEAKRQVEAALMQQSLEFIKERMSKEFGGNSGGIRERINAIGLKIENIEERTIETAEGLARLTGRFDEHTDK